MPILTVSNKPDAIDKPVAEWNNLDFIRYYRWKIFDFSGYVFVVAPPAWAGYAQRIKRFRSLARLSNEVYKRYIDFFFDTMCREHKYKPNINGIFSPQVWAAAKQLGFFDV